MNRRELFAFASAAAALTCAGHLYAAPAPRARFLLVFLRGGYDCANLLVPYSSGYYYDARPKIAIARPQPGAATGALALDADWALAPGGSRVAWPALRPARARLHALRRHR